MTNRIDHSACNHPKTPAARKSCRDGRGGNVVSRKGPTAADLGLDMRTQEEIRIARNANNDFWANAR
jgi:hypothetical protein